MSAALMAHVPPSAPSAPSPFAPPYAPPSRALVNAMASPALRGRHSDAARVLVLLYELLTPDDDRHVKSWYIADRLGLHRVNASRAVRCLASAGLIMRGTPTTGGVTYRLPASAAAA